MSDLQELLYCETCGILWPCDCEYGPDDRWWAPPRDAKGRFIKKEEDDA